VRLQELIGGLPVSAPPRGATADVRGVQHDSRAVEPGDLFVAISGARFDGRRFAADAVRRGAVAVLAAAPPDASSPSLDVPWLVAATPRELLAPLAARLYGNPGDEMVMVGVTGTNGKTTVTWSCEAMLAGAGIRCGRLGTVSYRFEELELPAARTTPEVSDLLRLLRRMRDAGAEAVAMEVSSHALALERLGDTRYDVAVFTNLTRDHLDFHPTMEDYFLAKRRLFVERLKPAGVAVVNAADEHGRRLAAELPRVVTFGEGGDVRAEEARLEVDGIRARVATPRGELQVDSPLLGPFNLENLLAVVAVGEALALPQPAMAAALRAMPPVPGRMERVEAGQPFPVFVDYAHTDDGLRNALAAVRRISRRKVMVVFGCGGDRDRGKRPLMGRVAGEGADLVLVTSDNPRSEDPHAIMAAIEEGLVASGNAQYRMLPDRRDAIRRAMAIAGEGWAVLVAGKGNESGQEVAGVVHPFSDRDEIVSAWRERGSGEHRVRREEGAGATNGG
jgi:UDP-N-acetylmuramoyl-L-alanyl-D-glutamate--2,6-diaminopimelate ligase